MTNCYGKFSDEEIERLNNELTTYNEFYLELMASPWFFPNITKIVVANPDLFNERNFKFNINIHIHDEVSCLQYLAIFFALRKKNNCNKDVVFFIVPEDISQRELNALYGKISRFLILFVEGHDLNERILFSKTPAYTKKHIDEKRMHYGQLWPYEKGGFADSGLPLIPLDANVYTFFQKNIEDFLQEDHTNSTGSWKSIAYKLSIQNKSNQYKELKSVVIREICKGFNNKFNAIASSSGKSKYRDAGKTLSYLKNMNVLTYLLFGASFWGVYNPNDNKKTYEERTEILMNKDNFITLYERCAAYSLGILQLIENTISYTDGGFLSLRTLKRDSDYIDSILSADDNNDDFLNISIVDIAKLNNDRYYSMPEVFLENLRHRSNDKSAEELLSQINDVSIDDLLFPDSNNALLNYLNNPLNIGCHYGLQIFASAVEGACGDFSVVSGNDQTSFSSKLSTKTKNKTISNKYSVDIVGKEYFCGTHFDILLPIMGIIELNNALESPLPRELSFEALKSVTPVEISIDCRDHLSKIAFELERTNDKYGKNGLISNFKLELSINISDLIRNKCGKININSLFAPLQINFIATSKNDIVSGIFLEILAKAIFALLSDNNFKFRNIVLSGFKSSMDIITFVRYYAQFYDRFGYNNSYAQNTQLMIATNDDLDTKYVTLSGKYIGKPSYDYMVFSGGRTDYDADNELIRISLEKIGNRTKNISLEDNIEIVNNPHCFDMVNVKHKNVITKRWIVDLYYAITTDFSDCNRFGAKIKNGVTHMHVSGVHIDTFYQIDQIFTNAYWSKMIGTWIHEEVIEKKSLKSVILFGYGYLTEPMLINVKELREKCEYIIFDEGYHYTAENISQPRLNYSCDKKRIMDALKDGATILFVMPISTTLGTFDKMANLLENEMNIYFSDITLNKIQNVEFLTLFQLIGADNKSIDISKKYFKMFDGYVESNTPLIKYHKNNKCTLLLKLPSVWQTPTDCKYCYPDNNKMGFERMLYSTDDTSLVPTMQLQGYDKKSKKYNECFASLDFFEKENDVYKYGSCLLYQHIERNAHFAHYIQTEKLLNKIIDSGLFETKATEIQNILKEEIENSVNVIVAPSHISNQKFSSKINDIVFGGKAHIISLNAQKIYRSNFEAEFSNYAHLANTIQNREKSKPLSDYIKFFYVDDHINTAHTYTRIKSLIKNLISIYDQKKQAEFGFEAIITLVDRHSFASRNDFIDSPDKFFSFFNFNIPAVRTNGDSCPLCKQVADDKFLEIAAALDSTAAICAERRKAHSVCEISNGLIINEKLKHNNPYKYNLLLSRHMHRFETENIIWNSISKAEKTHFNAKSIEDYQFLNKLSCFILDDIRTKIDSIGLPIEKMEYIISFLKILPRPFLSYRPFVATFTIALLRNLLDYLINTNIVDGKEYLFIDISLKQFGKSQDDFITSPIKVVLENNTVSKKLIQSLLIVCLTGLASLNSTYLLDVNVIKKIVLFYNEIIANEGIFEPLSDFGEKEKNARSFADYFRFSIFRLIRHKKFGEFRRINFDIQLKAVLSKMPSMDNDLEKFLVLLYLENSSIVRECRMNDAINLLHEEIMKDVYNKEGIENLSNDFERIFAQSIVYIDEKELHDKEEKQETILTPITNRGYCDAFNIGFDLHFSEDKSHFPIVSALNQETQQLWGKIQLDKSAWENIKKFGISLLDSKAHTSKYIFLKFSNDNELFLSENLDGISFADGNKESIILPQMPSLYLKIDVEGMDNVKILETVRRIISHRKFILQKFAKDFSTDDMNRLIAERRFNRALSITKASKHATEEAERLMSYNNETEDLKEKLIGQVRRLLANRTISGLYQTESTLFENENRGIFDDNNEFEDATTLPMWADDDPYDKYTQIWHMLKNGFHIYGNKQMNCTHKVKLNFYIDKSVQSKENVNSIKYYVFQEDKLLLDFIFLLANNAIRHLSESYQNGSDNCHLKFNILLDGEYLVFKSLTGEKQIDRESLLKIARALTIPPHVRKYFSERGGRDTDGITLWSISRYFRRLQKYFEDKNYFNKPNIIIPIIGDYNKCITVGYDYFNVSFEKCGDDFNFVVKLKCINIKEN